VRFISKLQNSRSAAPTVKKAISLLKDEGLIVGVAGYGTFVAER
jgi:DNA-binding GntR family transcriptional regulator